MINSTFFRCCVKRRLAILINQGSGPTRMLHDQRVVIHGFRREAGMNRDQFWLTDAQFSKIEPHLPIDTRGKARVDDRRVINGLVHVLKSGGRWVDAPPEYRPRIVWVDLFQALAQAGGPPAQVLIDSSAVKAHRSAAGGKGGENQAIGRSRGGLRRQCDPSPGRRSWAMRSISLWRY